MNYTQRFLSSLVEGSGGEVTALSPFTFRGTPLTVGFVEYYGYSCDELGNSIYEVDLVLSSPTVTPVVTVSSGVFQSNVFQNNVFQI